MSRDENIGARSVTLIWRAGNAISQCCFEALEAQRQAIAIGEILLPSGWMNHFA
jgi:hypothetical protein